MLLACRFTVAEADASAFTDRVAKALALLTAQPGVRAGRLTRSTDQHDLFLLTVEFESVPAYRRALSPFEVREAVVPLLSTAHPEPSAFEPLLDAESGDVRQSESLVAADAFTVRLGEAAGPTTAR
ncbi:hypothetical protein GCM10022243_24150 [Saccharothrix violaceirubra]|uniref:Quinol monooxygenase YgiN n=1 Tax=Saccharothrix violaceirubra TaxID=413306 RepID=A0A7W7T9U4_9PSEU|nr:antibiotic biosynthesis monooxygenase [Saccharothrix violaceirubra]MBB4967860.1 quinol monooxygenase YgiN [Saccharothrix violaceirubra]